MDERVKLNQISIQFVDKFKENISQEVLESLTMEDLWKSHNLKNYIEKNYPRAYLAITAPMREFGLCVFIKLAESQKNLVKDAINLNSLDEFPKKNLKYAIKVIKANKINRNRELWIGGVPFKFELSRFVENYAKEKTYKEWRSILNDLGASKPNIDRILERHRKKFKVK